MRSLVISSDPHQHLRSGVLKLMPVPIRGLLGDTDTLQSTLSGFSHSLAAGWEMVARLRVKETGVFLLHPCCGKLI